ncbi:MAG: outer membrane protein assembly factor BamE [Methylococcaceae bacterium]|nr:outer membrane protein assembly factor BamE [Methylococcaceae bacterium]
MSNIPGVYTIDILQGNMIDQDLIDQLRPNMTKRQVMYILGSPMIADTFHDKRWDYLYSEQKNGGDRLQKRVSLYFNGDSLAGVQGDIRPSTLPVVKPSTETTVDLPKREFDKSMREKVTGLFSFNDDATAKAKEEPAKPEPKNDSFFNF